MVKEQLIIPLEKSMLENERMGWNIVKEHSFHLMEISMLWNLKKAKIMIQEYIRVLMEQSMLGNGRMENLGKLSKNTYMWMGTL